MMSDEDFKRLMEPTLTEPEQQDSSSGTMQNV
jgi:hypothetical protein